MILPSSRARSSLLVLASSVAFMLTFIFVYLAWQNPSRIPTLHAKKPYKIDEKEAKTSNISEVIRSLYNPLNTAPTEPFIVEPDGTHIELPPNPRYTKNLGSDVLIVDLDTRQPKTNQVDWDDIDHVLGGIISHYTYAMAHGYDYKYIHAATFKDRQATWIKPSALANLIGDYKFVVFLDADATFRFMHLPIEWLLNYWEIEPHHSIVMAQDPWNPKEPQYNSDRFDRVLANTGFMLLQNNNVTMPMLKAWHECPEDVRYKGCSEWKTPLFHEQSAFGDYVRYDDEFKDSIKELACAEANGFPGVQISNCQGRFVRHYWFEKHLVKDDYRNNIMSVVGPAMRDLFSEHSIMSHFVLPIQKLFTARTGIVFEQTENVIRD